MTKKRLVGILISAAVVAAFLVYLLFNSEKFRPLLHINIYYILVAALLNILAIFINGLFTKAILVPFGKNIPVSESFFLSLISSIGNFFAPAGAGFGLRAIYLKRRFNLAYSDFLSTLAGNYIIVFLVDSSAGLIALWFLRDRVNSRYLTLLFTLLTILVCSLVLSIFRIRVPVMDSKNKYIGPVLRNLGRVVNGWASIVKEKRLVVKLTGLTLLNVISTIVLMGVIIGSLHFHISTAGLVLFSVLSSLSLFINITPANLGVKEAIYLFSASVLGFSTSQILSIALIDRGVFFGVLLLLWIASSKSHIGDRVTSLKKSQSTA